MYMYTSKDYERELKHFVFVGLLNTIHMYSSTSILRPPIGPKMWSYIAGGLKITVI